MTRPAYRNNDSYDVPHHDPQRYESVSIPDSAFDEAADAILGDDDNLMRDVEVWLGEENGRDADILYTDRFLVLAKLLRDESKEFRDWRDVRHGDEIRNKAIDIVEASHDQ